MIRTRKIAVPGREIGLTVPMASINTGVAPCEPDVSGLFWYRDGDYSDTLQTALLFDAGAANPKLTTARLLGETCDQDVGWSAIWENELGGDDGAPLVYPLGTDLDVVAAADTMAGLLTVRAAFGGQAFGPIDLLLLPGCQPCYSLGTGVGCALTLTSLLWEDSSTTLYASATGGWSHMASLIGSWPEGTVFNWSPDWTGSPTEAPDFIISGSACAVYRPATYIATGEASVAVQMLAPDGSEIWTDRINIIVS